MSDAALVDAFYEVCGKAAKAPKGGYLTLYRVENLYGGPEEGGWWYDAYTAEAYTRYYTQDQKNRLKKAIEDLAEEKTKDLIARHGQYCLDSLGAAEAKGLEASDIPEVDGPGRYVVVDEQTPGSRETKGRPHYE